MVGLFLVDCFGRLWEGGVCYFVCLLDFVLVCVFGEVAVYLFVLKGHLLDIRI